jgi:pimeloyl-ACP methyl ester carboxylesterase
MGGRPERIAASWEFGPRASAPRVLGWCAEVSMPDVRAVEIPDRDAVVHGDLTVPQDAAGLVVFAHGSGSGRHSPRNRAVAAGLQRARLATLLMDLLTDEEERVDVVTRKHRFDIPLLARRLDAAVRWRAGDAATRDLPLGLFGASTGAAAAIIAAAERPGEVRTVVSRGGRPDMAGDVLARVECPTLLIVGGRDEQVIALNERARARMSAEVRLERVPGATHLFEEEGALERVVELARDWFGDRLGPA